MQQYYEIHNFVLGYVYRYDILHSFMTYIIRNYLLQRIVSLIIYSLCISMIMQNKHASKL